MPTEQDYKATEKLALITSSRVRIETVRTLNQRGHLSFGTLKSFIEESLGEEVSDGNFGWHLEKLKAGGIVDFTVGEADDPRRRKIGLDGNIIKGRFGKADFSRRYYSLTEEGCLVLESISEALSKLRKK